MQTLSHSNAVPQKPSRNIAVIAVVGTLHLIVIYAVLASIDVVPIVFPIPPVHFQVFDSTRPKTQPIPIPNPVVQTKINTPRILVPNIVIDNSRTGGITGEQGKDAGNGTGTVAVTVVFAPATAIASTHTIPSYPPLDRRLGHEGKVRLKLTIDEQGSVNDAVVEQSSGFGGLDAAAIAWVKDHWRYQPATRDGKPVAATAQADVTFRLTQN